MTELDAIEAAIHEYLGGIEVEYLDLEESITIASEPTRAGGRADDYPRVIVTRREP